MCNADKVPTDGAIGENQQPPAESENRGEPTNENEARAVEDALRNAEDSLHTARVYVMARHVDVMAEKERIDEWLKEEFEEEKSNYEEREEEDFEEDYIEEAAAPSDNNVPINDYQEPPVETQAAQSAELEENHVPNDGSHQEPEAPSANCVPIVANPPAERESRTPTAENHQARAAEDVLHNARVQMMRRHMEAEAEEERYIRENRDILRQRVLYYAEIARTKMRQLEAQNREEYMRRVTAQSAELEDSESDENQEPAVEGDNSAPTTESPAQATQNAELDSQIDAVPRNMVDDGSHEPSAPSVPVDENQQPPAAHENRDPTTENQAGATAVDAVPDADARAAENARVQNMRRHMEAEAAEERYMRDRRQILRQRVLHYAAIARIRMRRWEIQMREEQVRRLTGYRMRRRRRG